MTVRVQGAATLKRAVRNSRTLKLVLPVSLRHLIGKYATRRMLDGILMITFSSDAGEVKVCPSMKTWPSGGHISITTQEGTCCSCGRRRTSRRTPRRSGGCCPPRPWPTGWRGLARRGAAAAR
jgi:hypothetical protein